MLVQQKILAFLSNNFPVAAWLFVVLKVANGNGNAWSDDNDKDGVQKPTESSDTVNFLSFIILGYVQL